MNEALPRLLFAMLAVLIIVWRQLDGIRAVLNQIAAMQRAQLQQAGVEWDDELAPEAGSTRTDR